MTAPFREPPAEYEGTITIEWPAPDAADAVRAWKVTPRTQDGTVITTAVKITVHVVPDDIVWAEMTMFTDADGKPVYSTPSEPGKPWVLHVADGKPAQGTFAFLVAGMSVGPPPSDAADAAEADAAWHEPGESIPLEALEAEFQRPGGDA